MVSLNDLIREYAKKNHPYAKGISQEEIGDLVTGLRKRFNLSEQESDFSPKSLMLIESKMVDLHRRLSEGTIEYTEEELVLLVRELAAYFIQVLILHSGGELNSQSSNLWSTEVIMRRPTTAVKGRERTTLPKLVIPAGNSVATAWDVIGLGKKPTLYADYKATKAKVLREKL